ncbi:MAG: amidohydrolase family protein [Rhodospirillaceae bacterium]
MPENQEKPVTVIKAGWLIDGIQDEPIRNALLVLNGKKIEAVTNTEQYQIPDNAEVIDADNCTVMPGLFDGHLHLTTINACSIANYRVGIFEMTPQLQSFYTLYHAHKCFEMGFTTLRDMGRESPYGHMTAEICAVRDAINIGLVPGPRIIACGRVVTTGSHHDMNIPRAAPRVPGATVTGPWAIRDRVREYIRLGADVIKACVSGGSHAHDDPDSRNITQEELDTIVDEAHAFKKPVAAHCWTPQAHRMCLEADVDTIEHMVFVDDETIEMIKSAGKPVSPTLIHRTDHAIEIRRQIGTAPSVLEKLKQVQPYCFEAFKKMHKAGVHIFMGTDTTMDPRMGENAMELELYVEHGMTPMEAIKTSTIRSAEALGLQKTLGSLEPGKLADVIAVEGDVLTDITHLQQKENIRLIAKEGHIFVDTLSPERKYIIHPSPGEIKIIDNL